MDVKNDLSTFGVGVNHDTISRQIMFAGEISCDHEEPTQQFSLIVADIVQRRDMGFGNDDAVERRLWTDVVEHQNLIIFVESVGRQLAGDDLAEDAVRVRDDGHGVPSAERASISRRPVIARDSVPLSINSSSPPIGTP